MHLTSVCGHSCSQKLEDLEGEGYPDKREMRMEKGLVVPLYFCTNC